MAKSDDKRKGAKKGGGGGKSARKPELTPRGKRLEEARALLIAGDTKASRELAQQALAESADARDGELGVDAGLRELIAATKLDPQMLMIGGAVFLIIFTGFVAFILLNVANS